MSNRLKWIVIVLLIAALSAGIFYIINQRRHSPAYIEKTVDKDTGEIIYNEPNKTKEEAANPSELVILGSPQLVTAGLTQDQVLLVKQILTDYVKKQLSGKYSVIKILPKGFSQKQNTINADLKLGETTTILKLAIYYHDLKFIRVTLADPNNNSMYNFDSGDLSTEKDLKRSVPQGYEGG